MDSKDLAARPCGALLMALGVIAVVALAVAVMAGFISLSYNGTCCTNSEAQARGDYRCFGGPDCETRDAVKRAHALDTAAIAAYVLAATIVLMCIVAGCDTAISSSVVA